MKNYLILFLLLIGILGCDKSALPTAPNTKSDTVFVSPTITIKTQIKNDTTIIVVLVNDSVAKVDTIIAAPLIDTLWYPLPNDTVALNVAWMTRTRVYDCNDIPNDCWPSDSVVYSIYAEIPDRVVKWRVYEDGPERFVNLSESSLYTVTWWPGEKLEGTKYKGECESIRTFTGNPARPPNSEYPPVDEYPGDNWWCNFDVMPYTMIWRTLAVDPDPKRITIEGFDKDNNRILRWHGDW